MNNPYVKLAAVLGVAYLVYSKVPNNLAKGAAMAIGSIVLAKQIPVVKDYL